MRPEVRVLPDPPLILGAIAQLGEHLLCKQGVVGSIPTGSTSAAAWRDGMTAHTHFETILHRGEIVFFENMDVASVLDD